MANLIKKYEFVEASKGGLYFAFFRRPHHNIQWYWDYDVLTQKQYDNLTLEQLYC